MTPLNTLALSCYVNSDSLSIVYLRGLVNTFYVSALKLLARVGRDANFEIIYKRKLDNADNSVSGHNSKTTP